MKARRLSVLARSCFAVVLAGVLTSCSGTSSRPTSPTPVPPMPDYPTMIGAWSGMLTVEQVVAQGSGGRTINICNETWSITTQITGQFSGTFQADGVCAQSGSLHGTVSTSGNVTGLTFSVFVGSPGETSTCRRVSGDGVYSGLFDRVSLVARTAERTLCVAGGAGLQFDRTFSLSMQRIASFP